MPVIAGAMVGTDETVVADGANLAAEVGELLEAVMVPVLHSDPTGVRSWPCRVHERTGLLIVVQDLPRYTPACTSPSMTSLTRWLILRSCRA